MGKYTNPDYHKDYYQKNKTLILDKTNRYHIENREKILKRGKKWYQEHKERWLEYGRTARKKNKLNGKTRTEWMRNYSRRHVLHVNGKAICGLDKRAWTGYCELCNKENIRLHYHHWDDSRPSMGIWICQLCHYMCEQLEKEGLLIAQRYFNFKQILEKEKELMRKLDEGTI